MARRKVDEVATARILRKLDEHARAHPEAFAPDRLALLSTPAKLARALDEALAAHPPARAKAEVPGSAGRRAMIRWCRFHPGCRAHCWPGSTQRAAIAFVATSCARPSIGGSGPSGGNDHNGRGATDD